MTTHPAQPVTEESFDVPAMLAEQIDTLESIRMTLAHLAADTAAEEGTYGAHLGRARAARDDSAGAEVRAARLLEES